MNCLITFFRFLARIVVYERLLTGLITHLPYAEDISAGTPSQRRELWNLSYDFEKNCFAHCFPGKDS